jgi:apolipoprotein N-acyltransferase
VLATARLRAAETGATVIVAGNTGPTAFVDPLGRLFGRFTAADGGAFPVGSVQSTFREGWATAVLREPVAVPTAYARWGDLPWLALAALLVLAALGRTARRRREIDPSPDEGSG